MLAVSLFLPIILAAVVSASPLASRLDVSKRETPSMIASAYFAGWHATDNSSPQFTAQNISFSKYTHVTYAFAKTTPDPNVLAITPEDQAILPDFVSTAHNNQVSVSIGVGGWTGSQYFSTAVGSSENRTAFINALATFASNYSMQGIDFDWEYPNSQTGCNVVSPNDTQNFLLLLQELRQTSSTATLTLSASVPVTPFRDESGAPSTNLSDFAKVLDFIEIMNYDVWGEYSPTAGPNAPLNDSCAPAGHQSGSATSAVDAWTKAGFNTSQLVLGVAAYGRSYRVRKDAAFDSSGNLAPFPPFDSGNRPTGDSWDAAAGLDYCGNYQPVGGLWQYWGLMNKGFLDTSGNPSPGINHTFNDCSQTAYVYNPNTEVLVSYDNDAAFTAKGAYIKSANLRGFAMWEAGGDFEDILLNAIRSGAKIA